MSNCFLHSWSVQNGARLKKHAQHLIPWLILPLESWESDKMVQLGSPLWLVHLFAPWSPWPKFETRLERKWTLWPGRVRSASWDSQGVGIVTVHLGIARGFSLFIIAQLVTSPQLREVGDSLTLPPLQQCFNCNLCGLCKQGFSFYVLVAFVKLVQHQLMQISQQKSPSSIMLQWDYRFVEKLCAFPQ